MRLLVVITVTTTLFSSGFVHALNSSGDIQFKPDPLKFPSVAMDQCRAKKIEAINNTSSPIKDPIFRVEGSNDFSVKRRLKKCPNPLEPGQSCSVYVEFCPPLFHTYEGALVFSGSEYRIPLRGRGFQSGR
jgi:hypothetical protein